MTPVIIIGGKIFGWFTATESACVAVLYAGALSIFVYREMDLKALNGEFLDTGKLAVILAVPAADVPAGDAVTLLNSVAHTQASIGAGSSRHTMSGYWAYTRRRYNVRH